MSELAPVFGILAVGVAVADTIPYVRDILRGTTRPHRGTWLVWGILAIVVTCSQHADGASWSVLVAAAQAGLTLGVFVLSISRGEGGCGRVDAVMLGVAAGGVAGWTVAGEPIVATLCIIGADLVAAAMMMPKTYRDPGSETLSTFGLASLSGALAVCAVGGVDAGLLLYPAYLCVVNGSIALVIYERRRRRLEGHATTRRAVAAPARS
jgi:hypothetical protein